MGPGMGGFSSDFGGQTGDISDLINSMFGGGFSQSRSPRPQRGPSHEAQLRLSFDEAITVSKLRSLREPVQENQKQ